MTEPASSAVGGFALWKMLTAASAGGSVLATFVVMCMMRPRTGQEWTVGLISTAVGSLAGGAYVAIKLGLVADVRAAGDDLTLYMALLTIGGLMFACGLPAWVLVRGAFSWMEKRKDEPLDQIIADARALKP